MKKWLYDFLNKFFSKNLDSTPVSVILDQMHEPRPLPLGMTEFETWSDRIIAGAMIQADHTSQKFALANMMTMMGATEDHKEDIFFIKSLRRSALQQIAQAKMNEMKLKSQELLDKKAAAEGKEVAKTPAVTLVKD